MDDFQERYSREILRGLYGVYMEAARERRLYDKLNLLLRGRRVEDLPREMQESARGLGGFLFNCIMTIGFCNSGFNEKQLEEMLRRNNIEFARRLDEMELISKLCGEGGEDE